MTNGFREPSRTAPPKIPRIVYTGNLGFFELND